MADRMGKWDRPVPVVGDQTSARQRAAAPDGWAFAPEQREALYAVMAGRRDVRRFRADPVPADLLERILAAAHMAPSVGQSQPWRFLVIQDPETRERAASMADRERLRQAAEMTDESARQMRDLQLDGIRDAPLGIVMACDRRTPATGVLGRATFADADLWSCACAIENLWLAARAEGLGLGWVTLFEPAELAALLELPEGVETLGWLCVGWPDERPPEPGLQRAGWSSRLPLDELVFAERWPEQAPRPPRSRLRAPEPVRVVAARDRADELLTPPGSLGVLDRAVDRLTAIGIDGSAPIQLYLAGADHPVTTHGVSTFSPSVTREVLEATVTGESLGATTAQSVGAGITVVDAGVHGPPVDGAHLLRPNDAPGDLVAAAALSRADVGRLMEGGRVLGGKATSWIVALGEVGIGNTTVAAASCAALLGLAPDEVVGLGAGGDSATLERKRAVVARALARACPSEPLAVLAELGGPELAVLAGVVLGAVASGSVVVLDGLATTVAAAVAAAVEPAVASHLVAGHRSREQAHGLLLTVLGLEPLLDLRIRSGEGVGALLAANLVRTAAGIRLHTAQVLDPELDRRERPDEMQVLTERLAPKDL